MAESTYSTEGPKCPHCGYQITADESEYYDEQRYTEEECPECGKLFDVSVYINTSWTCSARPT